MFGSELWEVLPHIFYVQELDNNPIEVSLRVCLENCNVWVGEEVSGDETNTSSMAFIASPSHRSNFLVSFCTECNCT